MAEGDLRMGKVAFVDKGNYSDTATYMRFNFVTTEDSCYLSLKDENIGKAVTDVSWWKCLAKGTQATEAAKKALEAMNSCNEVVKRAEAAIVKAETGGTNASAAASNANTAAEETYSLMLQGTEALNQVNLLIPELRSAIQTALDTYNLISKVEGVNVYAHLPATMVVEAITEAVVGSTPIVRTKMFPETANQSVVYQPGKGGCFATPDGAIPSPASAGEIVVYAISTQQSNVWREIKIRFRDPVARTTENGTARTTEAGVIIEC